MNKAVVYLHGKGGNAGEAAHYRDLLKDCAVLGFDYRAATPWEAQAEFRAYFDGLREEYDSISIIANSIGACFALYALQETALAHAYFISPVVNMEQLILSMLQWAGATEQALEAQGTIRTDFGETLSWEYLSWVRAHPVTWKTPTSILYGSRDHLQPREAVERFARETGAALAVMEGGEHWFHTPEQMAYLDGWLKGLQQEMGGDASGRDGAMTIETERLLLRKWKESDAESLFTYASDPDVGPAAGWPPHRTLEGSLYVIQHVFNGDECYAICEKGSDTAIGAVELKLRGHTDMTDREDECELGYWLGKPFWGRGYMPEAAAALLERGFTELGMQRVWCGYYDGNAKSKRVQEKLGFVYHHTSKTVLVPLLQEVRIGHTNVMTRAQWLLQKH